jgi:catalase
MPKSKRRKDGDVLLVAGPGGATHQTAKSGEGSLTTNQGVAVADNQNTLKTGERGPSLLEDRRRHFAL